MKYRITCSMLGGVGNQQHLRGDIVDASALEVDGADIDRLLSLGAIAFAEDDTADGPVAQAGDVDPLDLMTKAQLLEIAVGLGIEDVGKRTPNAELIELIRAAQSLEDDADGEGEDDGEPTDQDEE